MIRFIREEFNGEQVMSVREVRERMQELYVYDLYGFRTEAKVLASVLYPHEVVNCFATGIHEGKRKMLVVTVYRIIVISTAFASSPDIITIPREEISHPMVVKRFFFSSISFEVYSKEFLFTLVSQRVLDVFLWALEQPIPDRF